mgnify:CR=1 FL=1
MHFYFQVFVFCASICMLFLMIFYHDKNKKHKKLSDLVYEDLRLDKVVILADHYYKLRYCVTTKVYTAGCRVFTTNQAIEHWSRNVDDITLSTYRRARAALFLKAIERHEKELKK